MKNQNQNNTSTNLADENSSDDDFIKPELQQEQAEQEQIQSVHNRTTVENVDNTKIATYSFQIIWGVLFNIALSGVFYFFSHDMYVLGEKLWSTSRLYEVINGYYYFQRYLAAFFLLSAIIYFILILFTIITASYNIEKCYNILITFQFVFPVIFIFFWLITIIGYTSAYLGDNDCGKLELLAFVYLIISYVTIFSVLGLGIYTVYLIIERKGISWIFEDDKPKDKDQDPLLPKSNQTSEPESPVIQQKKKFNKKEVDLVEEDKNRKQ